jgi:hypothetical protein
MHLTPRCKAGQAVVNEGELGSFYFKHFDISLRYNSVILEYELIGIKTFNMVPS